MTATLLQPTITQVKTQAPVTPIVSQSKGHLVAHWFRDDQGKLYCRWFQESN